jgi:hypothetical protein
LKGFSGFQVFSLSGWTARGKDMQSQIFSSVSGDARLKISKSRATNASSGRRIKRLSEDGVIKEDESESGGRGRGRGGRGRGRIWVRTTISRNRGIGEVLSIDVALLLVDVPFELVGKVSGASAVTKSSHVEGSATTRHDSELDLMMKSQSFLQLEKKSDETSELEKPSPRPRWLVILRE